MALKATVFKAELQVADMDRHHYGTYNLTLARHPSETDERMMVRVLAFALFADPALGFGKGLCVDDEPDLWQKDLTGVIERWIDVGQPDEKWIRKACGRAREVVVLAYGRALEVWWNGTRQGGASCGSARLRARARDERRAGAPGRAQHAAAGDHPGRTGLGDQRPRAGARRAEAPVWRLPDMS